MAKEWYIMIEGRREGPFSPEQLREHPSVTPDTLVWKEGYKQWIQIRYVKELNVVFKDQPKASPSKDQEEEENSAPFSIHGVNEPGVMTIRHDPSPFMLWIILLLILSLILFYHFYG